MGKRVYGKPMLVTEAFVPQEYVAACALEYGDMAFRLKCDGDYMGDRLPHTAEGCLRPEAYTVFVDTETDKIVYIEEAPNVHGFQGAKVSNIKVDGVSYENAVIEPNMSYGLTWETHYITTYHHKGTLTTSAAQQVNMS
mgnify:CR=1 FL=1